MMDENLGGLRRVASGSRHHFAVNHQQTEVAAVEVSLHQDIGPVLRSDVVGRPHFRPLAEFTLTPLPWFPASGLTTTGGPTSWAPSHAAAADLTARPSGTGKPAVRSNSLFRGSFWQIATAISLV
jgi:hypothetical protein